MKKTFLFYDLETSGLNPAFDQMVSFACIRTDLDLTPVDRTGFYIQLRKDVIPSAGAFLTHQLTLDELNSGLCEYSAALKIHAIINQPGTISLGYNSMGFDDEFLRFTFYRNLLDSYTHQYSNGCSRMDILPVTTLYRVFNPKVMRWPRKNGKSSLKLEDISAENNFSTSGRAHEALNDVESTIELVKCLRSDPKMWSYSMDFFDKSKDESRIQQFGNQWKLPSGTFKLGIMVSSSFGPAANYLAPVMYIGESRPYPNQHLWVPLDKPLGLDTANHHPGFHVIRKRFGDQHIILPFLDRFLDHFTPDQRQMVSDNYEAITASFDTFHELISGLIDFKYPDIPDIDPDAGLYQDGFFSYPEKKEIERFHRADTHQKIQMIPVLQSLRVKTLAARILSRNFHEKGPDAGDDYTCHLKKVYSSSECDAIKGYRNDTKFNRSKGLSEIKCMREALEQSDEKRALILDNLEWYIRQLSN